MYHRPQHQLLEKVAIVGPVTAVAFETFHDRGRKIDVDLCLVARGPYVNIIPVQSQNGESSSSIFSEGTDKVITHLAFGKHHADSGTVHGIIRVPSKFDFSENSERLSFSTVWAFHGGKKLSFAFIDMASSMSTTIHFDGFDDCQEKQPYLKLTDWIWDVRVLNLSRDGSNKKLNFLSAIGMAQNVVEIWSLHSREEKSLSVNVPTLRSLKLRKIICDQRCITYSLSFYGWKIKSNDSNQEGRISQLSGNDLGLTVGVGTVSNKILIWNAIDNDEGTEILEKSCWSKEFTKNCPEATVATMNRKKVSHTLSGHLGVVYTCKFGRRGAYIASTSDDRTVRLWRRSDHDNSSSHVDIDSPYESSSDAVLIADNKKHYYSLQWTFFGHGARVWDCDFISLPNRDNTFENDGIISAGEDGALRIWNTKEGSLISTLKGHACQSIWKVCSGQNKIKKTKSPFAFSGANDGSVNIWDLSNELSSYSTKKEKFTLGDQNQVLCGMCFYPNQKHLLLIATKDGTIRTRNLETEEWIQHGLWIKSLDESQDEGINPVHGSCVTMHPTLSLALIGTTKGDILLCPIQSSNQEEIVYSARKYLAVQLLSWLDDFNLLSFHVKGIVIRWEVQSLSQLDNVDLSNFQLCMKTVLNMKTSGIKIGIPLCHYYDKERELIYIGDSRGNIALFDCKVAFNDDNSETKEQGPSDLLVYAHKKEHVTDIIPTSNGRGILSVGNDGRLNESTVSFEASSLKLQKSLSRPISNLTGVNYLWRSESEALIAGGYHGNEFVVVDTTTNRQLLSIDSGGRTRRIVAWIKLQNTTHLSYRLAICVANKKAPSEIIVHSNSFDMARLTPMSIPYSFGVPFHGETVLDVAICDLGEQNLMVLSGSNDCSVKLSTLTKSSISLIKELPPHESCIRALCFSRHNRSSSSLIVVCGGKLITTFYRLEKHEGDGFTVNFLCNNKLPVKPSIDHRMNAVKAIPSTTKSGEFLSHIVLAGDSDGGLHFTVLTEEIGQSRKVSSMFLTKGPNVTHQDSRPVLSIDMTRISKEFVLACVGTTVGEVNLWILSEGMENERSSLPLAPILTLKAHTMGANCLSIVILDEDISDSGKRTRVMISSGGDDQAVSLHLICISLPCSSNHDEVSAEILTSLTRKESCASAIKGIKILGDLFTGFRVFTTGYDQRIAMWSILLELNDLDSPTVNLNFLSSAAIDIKDINALDGCVFQEKGSQENTKEYILVGGEGLELVSFDSPIWQASQALQKCNKLLITCGAGFSADSGLATYETMPEKYKDFCTPLRMVDSVNQFQRFWLKFAEEYKRVQPHSGYSILERWCNGGKLGNLGKTNGDESQSISPWWIYSSNVDGHFRNFDCFKETTCEIHGRATEFRCANKIGYTGHGVRREGVLWDKWNGGCSSTLNRTSCKESKVYFSEMENDASSIFRCKECNTPMRPHVLMFHDTDENVLRDIAESRREYQKWEALVEEGVVSEGQHLVILELGAGKHFPAVRDESEEVFNDILEQLDKSDGANTGSVTLIRINPKDSDFERKRDIEYSKGSTILISEKAEHALSLINQALGQS